MSDTTTVLMCGVGGQGTILAADLLACAAMEAGYQVKLSEIHGMSQRGGAVSTVIRLGKHHVSSMVADEGSCDSVVSFETTEALRNIHHLKKDGFLLVADETIRPMTVISGKAKMPENAIERLKEFQAVILPASDLAQKAGNLKAMNVVLLGALSTQLEIDPAMWEIVIANRVPSKTIDINLQAFRLGRQFAQDLPNG